MRRYDDLLARSPRAGEERRDLISGRVDATEEGQKKKTYRSRERRLDLVVSQSTSSCRDSSSLIEDYHE